MFKSPDKAYTEDHPVDTPHTPIPGPAVTLGKPFYGLGPLLLSPKTTPLLFSLAFSVITSVAFREPRI